MTQEQTTPNKPTPTNWKEALADKHWKLKLADYGVQIDKDMRRHAIVERLIKKTQDGTLQTSTKEPADATLEEPMGVRIGDESHVHYHSETKSAGDKASGIGKTLASLGLAAAGLGAGVALPIAAYNMTRGSDSVSPKTTINNLDDIDREYGLRIYRDDRQQD